MLMYLYMLVVMQDTSYIKLYKLPLIYYLVVQEVDKQSQVLQAIFFYMPILAKVL